MIQSVLCTVQCLSLPLVSDLTLEEKVGQVIVAHFHGETANDDAKKLIQETHVGGIIYYNWANGLTSPQQVQELSAGLQKLAKETKLSMPLLITADQEGGVVGRFTQGFTVFPGNKALGMTGNPELAEKSAFIIGEELRAVGVNLNLAPVVDINSNPRNPVIGVRSYGEKPDEVVEFGKKTLEGYHKAKMAACLKHYPGHGDVAIDSHEDLPIVHKSKEELEKIELLPFAKLASDVEAVMTAHILVPAFDPIYCSTLSAKTLSYLRDQMGFKGVIFTDSLVMEGMLKQCGGSVDEAAIQALIAGCDVLCLGGKQLVESSHFELSTTDVQRIHKNIVQAVKNGRIPEERLNQSVERVLQLKEKITSWTGETSAVGTQDHQALAQLIANQALKVVKNNQLPKDLQQKKITLIAPALLQANFAQTTLKTTDTFFFTGLAPTSTDVEAAQEKAQASDLLLICSYNAWKNPSQAELIHQMTGLGKPVVLLVVRDALDATLFPKADWIMTTFSPTAPSLQAAIEKLTQGD